MHSLLYILLGAVLTYVAASVLYHVVLATAYFVLPERTAPASAHLHRFAVIIPAHDEELLIATTCRSVIETDYPAEIRSVYVIADNCSDGTAAACAGLPVRVLPRFDSENLGKGHALRWAFEVVDAATYDALVVVDADTTVSPGLLHEINAMLNRGSEAIQCYIEVPNRSESWFTQLIFLSRTINNLLYHSAKYKLGLSSYLMGSGMCFSRDLLRTQPWMAYSLSEDWEYFAELVASGRKVDFCVRGIVLQQESRSLRQATTQRLRWSKGKFHVVKHVGFRLFWEGVRARNWIMVDASLALLFPNWSLQVNLILACLSASWILPASEARSMVLLVVYFMLGGEGLILAAGVFLAGERWQLLKAILVAPLFLVWKSAIDFVSLTGLYRGKKWIRTERHVPR